MKEDSVSAEAPLSETLHEPHEHAHKRLVVGVGAVVALAVLGGIVWALWGEEIHEACFGSDGACEVELSPELVENANLELAPADQAQFDAI